MTTSPITTITDELLAELEQLAGKATPGPYRQCGADKESECCPCGQIWSTATDELVAVAHNGDVMIDAPGAGQAANAQYIARANPATILALLQYVRELRVDAERYRWLCQSAWYVGPEPRGDTESVSWHDKNETRNGVTEAIDAAIKNPSCSTS
jgi:hypothetical protein